MENGRTKELYDLIRSKSNAPIICNTVGVTYRATHKLRFWCVSAMYENNIPESVIMKYAGHKDVNTTRHYNRSRLFLSENDDEVRSLFAI